MRIRRRAAAAGIATKLGNHSFQATGITAHLKNGGTLEKAAAMANHASTRTTQLYDRRSDELSLDEVERIVRSRRRLSLVPRTLNDWTFDAINALCAAGQSESDQHDFKFNLAELKGATKICCAFANTFGGFIIVGVKDAKQKEFEIVGLDPDKELYGNFVAKIKAEPDITISPAKTIDIPGSAKLLYVLEVPQSPRRPHLPSPADQRVFWKRQGSACVQMTLEEIRYQMNSYEEKREKLALLLIDLYHKLRSVNEQAAVTDGNYTGDIFSFEIIDRVVVEAYAILKEDVHTFGALDTIKRRLMLLNAEKQKMLRVLSMSYTPEYKAETIGDYRQTVQNVVPGVMVLAEQIERSLKEKFGIVNPYKAQA